MLIKAGGALMIIFASVLVSYDLIKREKQRIECVEGFLALVSYIKDSIECYSMPVKKILSDCDPSIIKKLGLDPPVSDFGQTVSACEGLLSDDSLKTLREFSSTLGKSYRDVQIRICGKTVAELDGQRSALKAAYPSKRKTVIALCTALGGMAVIALI